MALSQNAEWSDPTNPGSPEEFAEVDIDLSSSFDEDDEDADEDEEEEEEDEEDEDDRFDDGYFFGEIDDEDD